MIDELQKAFALAVQQSEQEQAAIAARINEMIVREMQAPTLPLSLTLDTLYGALADAPTPEIERDTLPESRDETVGFAPYDVSARYQHYHPLLEWACPQCPRKGQYNAAH